MATPMLRRIYEGTRRVCGLLNLFPPFPHNNSDGGGDNEEDMVTEEVDDMGEADGLGDVI